MLKDVLMSRSHEDLYEVLRGKNAINALVLKSTLGSLHLE